MKQQLIKIGLVIQEKIHSEYVINLYGALILPALYFNSISWPNDGVGFLFY